MRGSPTSCFPPDCPQLLQIFILNWRKRVFFLLRLRADVNTKQRTAVVQNGIMRPLTVPLRWAALPSAELTSSSSVGQREREFRGDAAERRGAR